MGGIFTEGNKASIERVNDVTVDNGHGLADIIITPPMSIKNVSINLKHSWKSSQYLNPDKGSSLGKLFFKLFISVNICTLVFYLKYTII